jgi:hypothetical protein
MRNISDKNWIENQTTHFVLNHIFLKIMAPMGYWGKIWNSQGSHR